VQPQRDLGLHVGEEFQEQQIIPYDVIDQAQWLSAAGLSPSLQGLAAQSAVVVAALTSYLVLALRARRALAARPS